MPTSQSVSHAPTLGTIAQPTLNTSAHRHNLGLGITGQRWEPTRAPTQGPGPKRGVVHDTPFGSPQKNQRTSGLAQSDKSSRKYSPSLFLAPITPVTRVPLLTYRADLTHRFPRGPLLNSQTCLRPCDSQEQSCPRDRLQESLAKPFPAEFGL